MKTITIIIFSLLFASFSYGQTFNADKYFIFFEDSYSVKYFKMKNGAFVDYYLPDKIMLGDNEYYTSIRKYSWNDSDTSYYREDEKNYYHYNSHVNSESILFPKEIEMGLKWIEADSSWSYEVIGINKKLTTPEKKYKDLIVIECIQLTDRDKQKSRVYHIYYAKDIGMVGSKSNGELSSFLSEVKKNAKEGDSIGN